MTLLTERPSLLFYCQHSLGMGHLVRSFALAHALATHFRVVFLNGGKLPRGLPVPQGTELVSLPPLGMEVDGSLVSRDRRRSIARAQELRLQLIMQTFQSIRPQVVMIELFPFGRKKFSFELTPLLEASQQCVPRPLVLCSLRDILVGSRRDQDHHDERASQLVNRYFDGVLVHADPRFARLDESFHPLTPLAVPVRYTGFVFAERTGEKARVQQKIAPILVSAGGGVVGETLFRTAVAAHALLWPELRVPMKIIAGPFLPDAQWHALNHLVRQLPGVSVRRTVPDMCAEMRRAAVSISQCGYNTALDILHAEVPALVVPFSEGREDEQIQRARRLERLGALRLLEPQCLTPTALADAIRDLFRFTPQAAALNLRGARNTADMVAGLLQRSPVPFHLTTTQRMQLSVSK